MLDYALLLTRRPAAVVEADLAPLRAVGLDDRAIVDVNQVVSYFNYVNRVADGLGVELEESWDPARRAPRAYELARAAEPFPAEQRDGLAELDLEQSLEMDRIMIEELSITLERMMENAGRSLADVVRQRLGGSVRDRQIHVLAGPGGNGGGGLVAARHLANAGARVTVQLTGDVDHLTPVPRAQHDIAVGLGIPVASELSGGHAELVVDAMLGYSLEADPRPPVAELIAASRGMRVVSLDVPSGLEVRTGEVREPTVSAEATVALAAPKRGTLRAANARVVGALYVADISVPALVFDQLGAGRAPRFDRGGVVRVDD